MVRFRVLSGPRSGSNLDIARFPCVVGRSQAAEIRLEEPGVWDQHLRLELETSGRFTLQALPGALTSLNGQAFQEGPLRNGDVVEIGSVQLQFWLSETRQKSLRLHEWFAWSAIVLVSLSQAGLIWCLRG